jgi:hypothetical protein
VELNEAADYNEKERSSFFWAKCSPADSSGF